MRKREKKMAGEFLSLLDNAHREIRRALNNGETGQGLALLEQCQQGAISLGELIENTEGESCPAIALLESYCEMVYQFHEELLREPEVNGNKAGKKLHRQLIQIENSVRNDIKLRLEIVFLPYNASMWDSLESVWRAADADPDCDAYVVPIPYYDKNPDGSLGKYHYEGSLFPPYVPIVPYYSYPIEERRPDIIFIHNPYDNENYITTVQPAYYSANLKQYTEQLVYLPYFLLEEIPRGDANAVKKIYHFCGSPAVWNAGKTIVQSENMRNIYIDILTEIYGSGYSGNWEEKILGLGSPKVDKVLNRKREDLDIPSEWLQIIQRPDGSWKKIVFYNTTIAALLGWNQQTLEKIQAALHFFQTVQEDVALLWRPHPLMQSTLRAMRPQLWAAYQEIEQTYRSQAWGIYDDSPDIDRAIVLSDAYYGDRGSALALYQKTGKPILVQRIDILERPAPLETRAQL